MIDGLRLPAHWCWATFADVAEVASDLVDPTLTPDAIHIAPNHIESWTGKLLPYATVAADGVTSPKHRFHAGQILYSKIRPYLAKAAFATFEGVCSADMYPVEASIDTKFLLNWLLSPWFTAQTARNQGRTILPKINQDALGKMPVPVAPLSEQQRIAAKIEELFSDLDAGVAALERIKASLKRYRAAVLKAAVEGRLTEEWRAKHPKTEPASKLLERILAERRWKWEEDQLAKFAAADKTPPKGWREKYVEPVEPDRSNLPELPQGWCWVSLDATCSVIADVDHNMPKSVDVGVKFLSAKDLLDDGTLNFSENVKLISESDYKRLSRKVQPQRNDIIYSRIGARLGKARLVETDERFLVSYSCCTIRPVIVRPRFLARYLDCGFVLARALSNIQSIGVPDLGLDRIKKFAVPLCSVEEQDAILAELEQRLSIIAAAERETAHSIKRAVHLRHSILKRAFEGRLVPQDPTDEPADKLLDRIRQGRAATNGSVAPRTRRGRASSQQAECDSRGATS
jgi:type I restriction enzyme S subunit